MCVREQGEFSGRIPANSTPLFVYRSQLVQTQVNHTHTHAYPRKHSRPIDASSYIYSTGPELVEIRVPSAKRGDLVVMIPVLIDADQVVRGLQVFFFI